MHPDHRLLLDELRRRAGTVPPSLHDDSYTASGRPVLRVPVPTRRSLARSWLRRRSAMAPSEVVAVADSLFAGETHEEKTLGAIVLQYHRAARAQVAPPQAEEWIARLHGWAEVDHFCVFTADDLLADWERWRDLIRRLAQHRGPEQRRAALVLLVGPVRRSADRRIATLALETVGELAADRDPMVTKAVSWLLRSMVGLHRADVVAYVDANEAQLPRLAVREVRRKLVTGTKAGRSRVGAAAPVARLVAPSGAVEDDVERGAQHAVGVGEEVDDE